MSKLSFAKINPRSEIEMNCHLQNKNAWSEKKRSPKREIEILRSQQQKILRGEIGLIKKKS